MTNDRDTMVSAATQAFIYGYPMVEGVGGITDLAEGGGRFPVSAPWNSFAYARELFGPEVKFVSPNNDTLYTLAPLDLSAGPLVLHVPDTAGRYYVLQFVDAWTNNHSYIGRRATGTDEASYLVAPPGWSGDTPEGIKDVIAAPTTLGAIVGRVQVSGEADVTAAHAAQDGFTLSPFGETGAASGPPEPDARVADDLKFWEQFRVFLAASPPPDADAPFLAVCEQLGLTAPESPFVDPDPSLAEALTAGAKLGMAEVEKAIKAGATPINGWTSAMHTFDYNADHLGIGTIDAPEWKIIDRKTAYMTRAAACRAGLFGNHGYEANYAFVYTDAHDEPLSGENAYELTLSEVPPVDAFWSLTMYDMPDYYLVANDIGRYSIGSATEGLKTETDGSLTIYMQTDSPGPDKESNWLPTPAGPFRPIMRMYAPQQPILDGTYTLPAITKAR